MKLRFHKRDVVGNFVVDTSQINTDAFETMVFRIVGGHIDFAESVDENRYKIEEEAVRGHEEMIRKWS